MTNNEILKAAWNYCNTHHMNYVVAQANRNDMPFISFIAWELREMGISKTDAMQIASLVCDQYGLTKSK